MALYGTPVWFDRSRDAVNICRSFRTGAAIYDGTIVEPGLQTIACNPDIPLSIDADLIERAMRDDKPNRWSVPRTGSIAHWAVKLLPERKTCAVVLRNVPIHTSYEEACAWGFFGLLAEETSVHIDIEDAGGLAALSDIYRKTTTEDAWESMRDYFSSREVANDMHWFLKCVRTIWLKENDVLPMYFDPYTLTSEQEEESKELLERLPRFTYVIAVHLCTSGHELVASDNSVADTNKEREEEEETEVK